MFLHWLLCILRLFTILNKTENSHNFKSVCRVWNIESKTKEGFKEESSVLH